MSDEPSDAKGLPDAAAGEAGIKGVPSALHTYPDGSKYTVGNLLKRTFLDPVFILLTLAMIPFAVWGVFRTAADAEDQYFLTSSLLTSTAVLPAVWSVLCTIWQERAEIAIMVALLRVVIVPIVVCWIPAITVSISVHQPSIMQQIIDSRREDGWRYFFGEDDGSLLQQALVLTGLAGMIFAMLAALVVSVFVVLPALAWLKPIGAAKSNMLLTDTPEDRAAAKTGIRTLSVILMMTFGVPTLIIFGKEEATASSWFEAFTRAPGFFVDPGYYYGDLMWVLGILAIPAGIYLIIRLRRVQRPDIAKRAEYGVNSAEDHKTWLESQKNSAGAAETPIEDNSSNEPKQG